MAVEFRAWLVHHGAELGNFDAPREFPADGMRGVSVERPSRSREVLLRVPRHLMLSVETADEGLRALRAHCPSLERLQEHARLALFLLTQFYGAGESPPSSAAWLPEDLQAASSEEAAERQHEASPALSSDDLAHTWIPYLRMLPTMTDFATMPYVWTAAELAALDDEDLAAAVRTKVERAWTDFRAVREDVERVAVGTSAAVDRLRRHFLPRDFLWALFNVLSRTFFDGLALIPEASANVVDIVLVPGLDMYGDSGKEVKGRTKEMRRLGEKEDGEEKMKEMREKRG